MKRVVKKIGKKEAVFVLVFICLLAALSLMPTGFEKQIYINSEGVRAKIIEADNSGVYSNGLLRQGAQSCLIEIETGSHRGERTRGVNYLSGKLEFDKLFAAGDKAWVLLEYGPNGDIVFANLIDHYRLNAEIIIIAAFALFIILLSGFTGVKTLLSFAFTLLCIWKVLIPCFLRGYNPLPVALIAGDIIAVVTLVMVAGFTKKAYTAIAGSAICSLVTCILAVAAGHMFKTDGAVMQWSESLLYAGFEGLDLTAIFQAGIYLACSGAILDLSIDVSSAIDEIVKNSPGISPRRLLVSGLAIGKAVVGSQTATLLLAYMGSYLSVMMVFMAQGTPLMNILTSKMIASEILHTFVGCIGLVLVAPLTSLICAAAYGNKFSA